MFLLADFRLKNTESFKQSECTGSCRLRGLPNKYLKRIFDSLEKIANIWAAEVKISLTVQILTLLINSFDKSVFESLLYHSVQNWVLSFLFFDSNTFAPSTALWQFCSWLVMTIRYWIISIDHLVAIAQRGRLAIWLFVTNDLDHLDQSRQELTGLLLHSGLTGLFGEDGRAIAILWDLSHAY